MTDTPTILQSIQAQKKLIDQTTKKNLLDAKNMYADQAIGQAVLDKLIIFIQHGKTVRGSLFLLACQALNPDLYQKNAQEFIKIASALEIIHAGLLIHDDIIDQDEQRRGQASIWHQYHQEAREHNFTNSKNYGYHQAICVGSICLYLAQQLVQNSTQNQLISQEIIRTYLGEMLDSAITANPTIPTEASVLEMYRFKTARYTFSLPLLLAAQSSEQPVLSEALNNIGETMGLLFQIHDDWLGLFGDTQLTGKPQMSDFREGKKTIFFVRLHDQLPKADQVFLDEVFGRGTLTDEQVKKIQILLESHALPEIQQLIEELAASCQKAITSTKLNQATKQLLSELLAFTTSRQS